MPGAFPRARYRGAMRGLRYLVRQYTAMAVREHIRSQVEGSGGKRELTANEIELVRFIRESRVDWDAYRAAR
jgi:hypothetical protein